MAKKKTESTEAVIHNPELTKSLAILESFKAELDLQANNCLQIKIVDESTLAIGQQNLSKINQLVKSVEDKVDTIKDPYFRIYKEVMATGKSLVETAVKAVEHLKAEVKAWEEDKKRKAAEAQAALDKQLADQSAKLAAEEARKSAIREKIESARTTLQQYYTGCTTVEFCYKALNDIRNGYRPREFFEEMADEAYALKDNYLGLIETKLIQLQQADTMSVAEKELAAKKELLAKQELELASEKAKIKAIEDSIEAEKKAKEEAERLKLESEKLAAQQYLDKTRGIRHTWKYELVDKSKLIPDWICLDEVAAKEFIKANKDTLADGSIINGVKFFKDISVIA